MKQKDVALIIVVCAFSAVLSLLLSNVLFGSPKNRQQKAEKVAAIDSSFPLPDNKFFNPDSIDPTRIIRIGDNTNSSPFKDAQN